LFVNLSLDYERKKQKPREKRKEEWKAEEAVPDYENLIGHIHQLAAYVLPGACLLYEVTSRCENLKSNKAKNKF
jgi:hypothetical protein